MKLPSFVAKKSPFRSLVSVLVATVLAGILAAGCSSKTTSTTSSTATAAPTTTTSITDSTSIAQTTTATPTTTVTTTPVATTTSATTPTTNATTATTTVPTTTAAASTTTTQTTPSTTTTATTTTTTTITAAYSISVAANGQQVATLTLANLSALPQVTDSSGETGPTLMSVLNSVGITNFTSVTVNGFTSNSHATAATNTLQKSQVTNNVMLALVARGTAKLTGSDVTTNVIDVAQIVVQ